MAKDKRRSLAPPSERKPKAAPEPKAQVKVTLPGGRQISVAKGTTLGEVYAMMPDAVRHPIIGARFNNKVTSLQRPVDREAAVDWVEVSSRDGGLIFRRSLTFVLVRAVAELFPSLRVYINHSLNGGYYGEVYDEQLNPGEPVALAESDYVRIRKRMSELIEADEPFHRDDKSRDEAIEEFRRRGMLDKVSLLEYRPDEKVSIYYFGRHANHFYGQLAPSAGCLKPFEIVPCPPGFVLRFPPHGQPGVLSEYRHQAKLFAVFQEYERWARILGLRTVAQLNTLIDTRQIREYVLIAEALQEKKIAAIADAITNSPRKPRIILLAGPSSSGKTTSVKRLSIQLRVNGQRPLFIGMDDFFLPRERTPRDETGEYDFESIHALDIETLQNVVTRLLHGEKVVLPHFDFKAGRPQPGQEVRLEPGQPLILEGIHGLNTELLSGIPDGLKFKIYVSPLTHLNIDNHNRIASSDARLIRRIVRDSKYRGYDAMATINRWKSVRRGEERNIFPYQEMADVVFNSSLPYELNLLKQFAEPLLAKVPRTNPAFSEASRLLKFLSYFRSIEADIVPRHSLLREFIGGSSFKY